MQLNHYASDLYILPSTEHERDLIINYLKSKDIYYTMSYSNVKDQSWYGKTFIEIPFMNTNENLKTELVNLINGA